MDYKYSMYNLPICLNNETILLHNTKTGYTIRLDKEDFEKFKNINILKGMENFDVFIKMGFIVDIDADEFSQLYYEHICRKYDKSVLNITVQTTNQCNFACPYCYQEHIKKIFDEADQEIFLKYIKKQIKNGVKKIYIHWFGGEPTLNMDAIYNIEHNLILLQKENQDIEIKNYMTSNGYLLDLNTFKKISKYTNIKDIQITIDGIESIHNQTRLLKNEAGSYKKIVNNIIECLKYDSDVTFTIRHNVNKQNLNFINEFLEDLKIKGILNNNRVELVFQQTHNFNHDKNENLYFDSKKQYAEEMLKVYRLLVDYGISVPKYSNSKYYNCIFDTINSYLLTPDMEIYHCSAVKNEDDNKIGKINNEGEIVFNKNYFITMNRKIFEKEKCKLCTVFPICYGGCSNLEKSNDDECIAEKYAYEEYVKLYNYENSKLGDN